MNKRIGRLIAGFTMVELIIVVAVIGILAGIAYPSYLDSVRKSRRADAMVTLLTLAGLQEKFYIQKSTYTTEIAGGAGLNFGKTTSTEDYYSMAVTAGPTADLKSSFTLTATPVAGKSQADDDKCYTFSIDSRNLKIAKTAAGSDTDDCW